LLKQHALANRLINAAPPGNNGGASIAPVGLATRMPCPKSMSWLKLFNTVLLVKAQLAFLWPLRAAQLALAPVLPFAGQS
jgi:hypothetical protein